MIWTEQKVKMSKTLKLSLELLILYMFPLEFWLLILDDEL